MKLPIVSQNPGARKFHELLPHQLHKQLLGEFIFKCPSEGGPDHSSKANSSKRPLQVDELQKGRLTRAAE